ncbi:MAG: hypothetical protein PVH19_07600 [Planctomycetia bacterium]
MASKKRQFAINAASGLVDQAVRIGAGLVMVPYLMWRLGLDVYGISEIARSAVVFFGFLQLGMGPALVRFCSQAIAKNDQDEVHRVSSTAQAILGVLGIVGMLGIVAFIPFFFMIYEVPEPQTFEVSMLLFCMAASLLLNFTAIVPQGLSLGCNRYDLVNMVGIVGSLLRLGLVVATFELFGPSLLFLGVSIFLVQLFRFVSLFAVAAIHVGRSAFPSFQSINKTTLRSLLGFSALNLISAMAGALVIQGPILIVGKTLGNEMAALFAPVVLVATAMQGVLGQITSPLTPLASQAQSENNPQKMGHWSIVTGGFVAAVGLAVALPLCVFGNEIISLWLGANKAAYLWTAIAATAVGTAISQTATANSNLSLGGGCIRPVVYSQVVLGIAVFVGVAIGTGLLGWQLLGVVVFSVICRCLRSVLYLTYAYSKQFFYSTSHYLWAVYVKSLLVFIGVLGGGFVIRRLVVPDRIVLLGIDVTITLVIYLIAIWYFVISIEIKKNIHKLIPGFRRSA